MRQCDLNGSRPFWENEIDNAAVNFDFLSITSLDRESVELRDYLRLLRRQWILITLVTLIGLGLAILLTALTPKTYTARSTAFISVPVSAPTTSGTSAIADASTFAQTRVKSYVGLSDSQLVLQPVIDQLGLKTTVAKLALKVSATNPVDTVLIDVEATDKSKVQAARISNAVSTKLAEVIETLEQTRNSTQSQVKVTITKPASTPTSPVSPKPVLNYALGLVIGLALGVA
ncbi:MAG: polysaccharide biosynthesis tyrosine autokinase, partial [Pseudonocardiales bacterium]|nr:polysaccharide biosynthesis tyrosine autokinase [Pseudonocardiales bacterium]